MSISAKYLTERLCVLCRCKYTELNNIGRLLCRIHPGIRLCDHDGREFFSCCGFYVDQYGFGTPTRLAMRGCVAIDHMDDSFSLDNVDLDLKLREIKTFSIICLPSSVLETVHRIFPPLPYTMVVDFRGVGMPRETLLTHHLAVFNEIRQNHNLLAPYHDPYKNTNLLYKPLVENAARDDDEKTMHARDSTIIDVQDVATRLSRNKTRVQRNMNTGPARSSTSQDRWPTLYTRKDGSIDVGQDADTDGSGGRKETVPFMIIQRIDVNVTIPDKYSKLTEKGGPLSL